MTAQNHPDQLPRISLQELELLSFEPGHLKVVVKQVSGYYMPFVYHTSTDENTTLRGIIVDGEDVLATVELTDAVFALKELIGSEHTILTPETPGRQRVH